VNSRSKIVACGIANLWMIVLGGTESANERH